METSKAHARRVREGFFDKYIQGNGIDIGVGRIDGFGADLVHPDAFAWDKDNGDATFMEGVEDATYDFIHSSHCLEHLSNPYLALRNWWRILKPGGYLILLVPHRDLYEKKRTLPSIWNPDHKFFLLPETEDLPHTLSLLHLIQGALAGSYKDKPPYAFIEFKVCDEGWEPRPEHEHSVGEYSIEVVLQKI